MLSCSSTTVGHQSTVLLRTCSATMQITMCRLAGVPSADHPVFSKEFRMNDSRLRRLRDLNSGPATLINEGCRITGFLEGTGSFLVSGEVHGDCDLAGTVTLSRSGFWKGTLKASAVIVAGRVEGEIVSDGRIEIGESANIDGRVTGAEIAVAAGAIVQGTMNTTRATAPVEFTEKRTSRKP